MRTMGPELGFAWLVDCLGDMSLRVQCWKKKPCQSCQAERDETQGIRYPTKSQEGLEEEVGSGGRLGGVVFRLDVWF